MKKLTDRQKQVLAFLKGKGWTSPTEIGRSVWGNGHHSSSASPVCKRLVQLGALERNDVGHYRRQEPFIEQYSPVLDEAGQIRLLQLQAGSPDCQETNHD